MNHTTLLRVLFTSLAVSIPVFADSDVDPATLRAVKTLHMLLVFDDRASHADRLGIQEDMRAWTQTFGTIANNLNLQPGQDKDFTLTVLHGKDVTPERIRAYYDDLQLREQEDGLLFLYSGHGAVSPRGGHYLMLHNRRRIARQEILSLMLRKNAALTVLLTDACGVQMNAPPRLTKLPIDPKGELMCRSLFYFHRGVVDINSTEMGRPAYGHAATGGNFGHAFRRLLYGAKMHDADAEQTLREIEHRNQWQDVTWSDFLKMLATEMRTVSLQQKDGLQQPYVFQLPGGYLGVQSRALPQEGRPQGVDGVLVQEVFDNSPASAIGVRNFDLSSPTDLEADLIVKINDIRVSDLRDFEQVIDRSDGKLTLTLLDPFTNTERVVYAKLDPHQNLLGEDEAPSKRN